MAGGDTRQPHLRLGALVCEVVERDRLQEQARDRLLFRGVQRAVGLVEDLIQLILRKGQHLLVGEPEAGLLELGHYMVTRAAWASVNGRKNQSVVAAATAQKWHKKCGAQEMHARK